MSAHNKEVMAEIPKGFLLTTEKFEKILAVYLKQSHSLTEEEVTDLFKVKEIRPEGPGETWEYNAKALKIFTFTNSGLGLSTIDEMGQISVIPPFMVHGKRGFTRIEPPVEKELT